MKDSSCCATKCGSKRMDPKEEVRVRGCCSLMFLFSFNPRLALGADVWQAGCKALQLEQHSLCSEAALAVHLDYVQR